MNKIDYNQIALSKAKELGYDTIRYAGEREGWKYFHLIKYSSVVMIFCFAAKLLKKRHSLQMRLVL
jgi:hypothetical protein